MASVWFSLGSNIDKEKNVRLAIRALDKRFSALWLSPIYQTKAVGFDGYDFYNLIGRFETNLSITQLRDLFDDLERQSGRQKTNRHFENRTLDVDLLFYDNLIFQNNRVTVPHPDILEYDFILLPLSQMIPDFIHPTTGLTLSNHWVNRVPVHELKEIYLDLFGPDSA